MGTFLRTQSVALTEQGHAWKGTRLLDPAAVSAASLVTGAWRAATPTPTSVRQANVNNQSVWASVNLIANVNANEIASSQYKRNGSSQ